jgi:hypothetical protein
VFHHHTDNTFKAPKRFRLSSNWRFERLYVLRTLF